MARFYRFCFTVVVLAMNAAAMTGCGSHSLAESPKEQPATSSQNSTTTAPAKVEAGMPAIKTAATANKYLFVLFLKEENDQTAAMRKVLEEVVGSVSDKASSVEVNITDKSEKPIVDEYGVDRAPMPLLLAIAPNGAITGGFPNTVDKASLMDVFVTPCTAACMKGLQENKLVFVCVQNGSTKSNDVAMKGVEEFKADARFAQATEIVKLDPADAAEADFLKDLQVDPATETAVTVFVAPSGTAVARYEGATDKDEIVATLEKASACGPGGSCGPGGCPPK